MNYYDDENELTDEQREQVKNSILSKYQAARGDNSDIEKAEKSAKMKNFALGLTEGITGLAAARAGEGRAKLADSSGYWNNLKKGADSEVDKARLAKQDKIQNVLTEDKLAAQDLENDPNSEESKMAQALAKKLMPQGDFSRSSAAQLKKTLPTIEKMYSAEQASLARAEEIKARKSREQEIADARAEAAREKADAKAEALKETHLQKLSKDIGGTQPLVNALDEVETELGFKLEDAEAKGGKLKVGDKERDLPGVNIPGFGRTTFYSEKSRNLQSAADRVFNATLKDRSGAAVTNPELDRLRREFNEGKFNTESEMVSALQRYKRGVTQEMKNREAGYTPEVVDTYTDRGGRTSRTVGAAFPKWVSNPKTGERVDVNNEEELKEALAEGFQ